MLIERTKMVALMLIQYVNILRYMATPSQFLLPWRGRITARQSFVSIAEVKKVRNG